jgi:hypothetical protein
LVAVATLLAVALPLVTGQGAGATATAQPIELGPIGFGSIVVDNARGHVVISGPVSNVVDVYDENGTLLKTFTGEGGATGMVIVGSTLYIALAGAGAIGRIDLPTLTQLSPLVTGLNSPMWLAFAGGKLWTAVIGGRNQFSPLESIDMNGTVTPFPTGPIYFGAEPEASPALPNTLFVTNNGDAPPPIDRLDVSSGIPVRAATTSALLGYVSQFVVSPDGTRVIPDSGVSGYEFSELSASTLAPDGVTYPGAPYTEAVAVTPAHGGLVATGLMSSTPDIEVHPIGGTADLFQATTSLNVGTPGVAPHGLAFTDDGSRLFAVSNDGFGSSSYSLFVFTLRIAAPSPLGWLPLPAPYPDTHPWLTGGSGGAASQASGGPATANLSADPSGAGGCADPGEGCATDPSGSAVGSTVVVPRFAG